MEERRNSAWLLIVLIVTLLLLVVSCQTTPNSDIVIGKNDGALEEAFEAEQEYDPMSLNFPEHWEAEFEELAGRLTVSIDADIVAEQKAYHVVKIEPLILSIDQADSIIEALFGTTDVYHVDDSVMTKGQIEASIIEWKKEKAQLENKGRHDEAKNAQMVIEDLTNQLRSAPEDMEAELYDHSFISVEEYGTQEDRITVKDKPLDADAPFLYIFNTYKASYITMPKANISYISTTREMTYSKDIEWDLLGVGFSNPIFHTDEAIEAMRVADDFLKQIGAKDRVIERIYTTKASEDATDVIGYRIGYGRQYDNTYIPSAAQSGGSGMIYTEESAAIPVMQKCLDIEIENGEIMEFQWNGIYETGDIIRENIAIMPFESIMANIENQLMARYAYLDEFDKSTKIYVDKIVLTYAIEPIKDAQAEYMLIPVWAFYGGEDYGEGQTMLNGSVREGKIASSSSLLTVSAIDGSAIQGY